MANDYLDVLGIDPSVAPPPKKAAASDASQAPTASNDYLDRLMGRNQKGLWQQIVEGGAEGAKDLMYGTAQAAAEWGPKALSLITGEMGAEPTKRALAPAVKSLQDTVDERKSVFSEAAKARDNIPGALASGGVKAAPAIAASVVAPELFATPLGSAALGGVQGAVEPTGADDSRAMNTALGLGLGYGGQKLAGGATGTLFGAKSTIDDPARRAAVKWLEDRGGVVPRSMMTGDPFTALLEKVGSVTPGSKGWYINASNKNAGVLENAADVATMGGTAGATHGNIASQVRDFTPTAGTIGDIRAVTAGASNLKSSVSEPTQANEWVKAYTGTPDTPAVMAPNPRLEAMTPTMKAQAIAKGVPEMVEVAPAVPGAKGVLEPGKPIPFGDNGYLQIRSDLGRAAMRAGSGSADQKLLFGLQEALDNGAYESMRAAGVDPAILINARGAYAVDKMLRGARTMNPDGSVTWSPAKIAAAVGKKDANQQSFLAGLPGSLGQDVREMANAARFMGPVKSSNTTELGLAKQVMTGELASHALTDPSSLVKMGTYLYAIPALANTLLQGTRYGIPGLRNYAGAGATLRQIMSGGAYQGARTLPNILLQQSEDQ